MPKAKTTPATATTSPEYDAALAAFHQAEQHLADLRQRRAEAERTAADLHQQVEKATAARKQALVDADMKLAARHGDEVATATRAHGDAVEIAAAMAAGIESAEFDVLQAEDRLDDERRRVLDQFADEKMPHLLAAVRELALPIYRARAGAGDQLSYSEFLRRLASEVHEPAFGNEVDDLLNLPCPSFRVRSEQVGYTRRRELGLPAMAA